MEVSTPSHPRYGQHLKRDQLKDLIKPRADSTASVLNWLEQSGIEARDIQNDGEWINFLAPVKRAEQMMGTTFKTYQSQARPGIKRTRSLGYSVPVEVRGHIDMIQPVCPVALEVTADNLADPITTRLLASARCAPRIAKFLHRR
jgi:tripeptidyl-peptidase-1